MPLSNNIKVDLAQTVSVKIKLVKLIHDCRYLFHESIRLLNIHGHDDKHQIFERVLRRRVVQTIIQYHAIPGIAVSARHSLRPVFKFVRFFSFLGEAYEVSNKILYPVVIVTTIFILMHRLHAECPNIDIQEIQSHRMEVVIKDHLAIHCLQILQHLISSLDVGLRFRIISILAFCPHGRVVGTSRYTSDSAFSSADDSPRRYLDLSGIGTRDIVINTIALKSHFFRSDIRNQIGLIYHVMDAVILSLIAQFLRIIRSSLGRFARICENPGIVSFRIDLLHEPLACYVRRGAGTRITGKPEYDLTVFICIFEVVLFKIVFDLRHYLIRSAGKSHGFVALCRHLPGIAQSQVAQPLRVVAQTADGHGYQDVSRLCAVCFRQFLAGDGYAYGIDPRHAHIAVVDVDVLVRTSDVCQILTAGRVFVVILVAVYRLFIFNQVTSGIGQCPCGRRKMFVVFRRIFIEQTIRIIYRANEIMSFMIGEEPYQIVILRIVTDASFSSAGAHSSDLAGFYLCVAFFRRGVVGIRGRHRGRRRRVRFIPPYTCRPTIFIHKVPAVLIAFQIRFAVLILHLRRSQRYRLRAVIILIADSDF